MKKSCIEIIKFIFYLFEYSVFVVNNPEQSPLLLLEETIVIADELGLKLPPDSKTNEPVVKTRIVITTSY